MPNIVYVLSNPAMPGLIKIGLTQNDCTQTRINQLYTTSVPVPFKCEYACIVEDCRIVERALHTAFSSLRVNLKREFFEISAEQAISILKLLALEDVTPQVEDDNKAIPIDERAARETLAQRRKPRPVQNFIEMGLNIGSSISTLDGQGHAVIASARSVLYLGREVSLAEATRQVYGPSAKSKGQWAYEGKALEEIYEETYPRNEI